MAIIVDSETRLLVQGITGREGSFHATRNKAYGTNVVAGVTPGKGGADVEGIPVFDSVREAVAAARPNTALIFVPARFAADAIYESIDAGIGTGSGPSCFRMTSCTEPPLTASSPVRHSRKMRPQE